MNKNISVAAFILLLSFFVMGTEPYYNNYNTIVNLVVQQKYDEARNLTKNLAVSGVDSLFLGLIIDNGEMVDYESYAIVGDAFITGSYYLESLIKRDNNSTNKLKNSFYLGIILGARGLCKVKQGNLVSGIDDSRKSEDFLNYVVTLNPNNKAAIGALALYNYYLAVSLKWIPFAGGSPKKQLNDIEEIANLDSNEGNSVKLPLMWIYLDNKEYNKCESLLQKLFLLNRENSMALKCQLQLKYLQKDINRATVLAHKLMDLSEKRVRVNWADYFSGADMLVTIACDEKNYSNAASLAEMALYKKVPSSDSQIDWVKKHKNNIREKYEFIRKKYPDSTNVSSNSRSNILWGQLESHGKSR